MNTDLRLTDTNAASDSKGRTWGLEGNLVWWLIGGVGASIVVLFVLVISLKARLMTSLGVAVVPVLLCLAYIFGLRHGKPPGYDRDCLEHWVSGTGFSPDVRAGGGAKHPLAED
jgi:hypothetical protein